MESMKVIKDWEKCLNNNQLEKIVDLYYEDSVLWGTFSTVIRDNAELISEYFQGLFGKEALQVEFNTMHARKYGEVSIFSGTYTFSYNESVPVHHPARFTFVVYQDAAGKLKIAEHHSSLIPHEA